MQTPLLTLRINDQLEHAVLAAWSSQTNAGLCAVDDKLNVVMLNPAACEMLGVDALVMLGQPFTKLVAAVDFTPGIAQWLCTPDVSVERNASLLNRGVAVELLFKSTTVRLGNNNSIGGTPFKVISISDITQLLASQRQVNSESFRRQWQALNAGVLISDARAPDAPIVYVNAMFERMTGYAAGEVLGRNCRFMQGAETNQPGLAAIRNAILSQSNGYARLRNYRKDGSVFVNELFISPVMDTTGVVTHFVGIQHLESSLAPTYAS